MAGTVLLAGQSNPLRLAPALAVYVPQLTVRAHDSQAIQFWQTNGLWWPELQAAAASRPAILIWWQGESDAGPELQPRYRAELRDLMVNRLRPLTGPETRYVFIGVGHDAPDYDIYRTMINQDLQAIASEMGALFVPTADGYPHIGDHLSPEGYEAFARDLATKLR